jgi:hypothetical protein
MTGDDFQLVILRSDLSDLKLGFGFTYENAFPKLKAAGSASALFVVGTDQIETYRWATQSITLTDEGTRGLLAALEPPEQLKESVRGSNSLRARLGWGDRLDHGLYTKGFLVALGGEALYGGIFLDATSQRPIQFPVIRAFLNPAGRARFNLLPVHVPFFRQDPVTCADNQDEGVAREMKGDWQQFPTGAKALVAGWGTTDTAKTLRELIRSRSVQVIMERAGKIR